MRVQLQVPDTPLLGGGHGWGFRAGDLCLHWHQWEGSLKYKAWSCPVGASGQLANHKQGEMKKGARREREGRSVRRRRKKLFLRKSSVLLWSLLF